MRILIKSAIRLLIIWIFFNLFLYLGNSIAMLVNINTGNMAPMTPIQYFSLAIPAILALIGILILCYFWTNTDWLIKVIAEDIDEHSLVIKTSNLDLMKVVFRILGIYLIVTQIPTIFGLSISQAFLEKLLGGHVAPQVSVIKQWIEIVFNVLIGLWLLFGGKGIVEMFDRPSDNEQTVNKDCLDDQSQQ